MAKDNHPSTPGPLVRKVLAAIRKPRGSRVVDLQAYRSAQIDVKALQKTIVTDEALAGLHPAHAVYVHIQNQISVLVEQLTAMPELRKFADIIGAALDEYMPSGPPISPLTTSYFSSWAFFDLAIGLRKETLASCVHALGRELGVDAGFLEVLGLMSGSRMGIYVHEGANEDMVLLREMITGTRQRCLVPCGYGGQRGELWLARVLPPPLAGFDCSVVFTTPYVLRGHSESDWLAYLQRTLEGRIDKQPAYERLMKYGQSRHYWNEFIFEAYQGHITEAIFLSGLPDIAATRPHSRENAMKY